MKILSALLLCSLSFSTQADVEKWYAYWGIGTGINAYPSSVEKLYDGLDGGKRSNVAIDAWGFYWALSDKEMLGFILTESIDTIEKNVNNVELKYKVDQGLYSLSGMRFFGKEIGDGFFIRGDVGLASIIKCEGDDSGFGAVFAGGYGFPVSKGTRILATLQTALNIGNDGHYTSLRALIGVLW